MVKFDLRLDQETVEQIKKEAEKDSRTVSAMARKILEDYFKPHKGLFNQSVNIDVSKLQVLIRKPKP